MRVDPSLTAEADTYWKRLSVEAQALGLHDFVGYGFTPNGQRFKDVGKLQRAIWDARAEWRAKKAEERAQDEERRAAVADIRAGRAEEREKKAVARAEKAETRGKWSLRAAWAGVLLTLATAGASWYMVLYKTP